MSKKIILDNVDSSELPEIPVIGEVKQIRFTQDMELVSTLADSDLFMVQAGADLEARPNTITFDLIIKNLSGPIEEGSKKFVTGDEMFKVIGDITLLDTWNNTNIVSSLNATYVNVRRIEEELRREINRSTGVDELHDSQIANLRQDLTSTTEMLNQEINRSVAKDKEHDELLEGLRDDVDSISSRLESEIDRSTAKDAEHDTLLKGLRVDVNANKSAIESEVARSTARDEDHDEAISKNASDITAEVNRAKAEEAKIRQEMKTADTNLQNAITAETERATGVEEDLQQQITDLSGSTDDRLEALEALSHEQNTDTGTTSKTFTIDSASTGIILKAEGGGLSTRTKGDAGYANFTVQNLVIKGDVTQEGDTFITQAERVEVRDNMILINEGETGAGVTAGFAGIEVDRGTEQNFMFGFNESDGMFKIGKEGNMFDVALRQPVGDMIDGMFASWDAATKTFKTTNLIPPTLQLYLGVPEVSIKYLSSDDGSIKFMTNGMGWSAFTGSIFTNFRSDRNKFQFIGELRVSTGIYDTIGENFTIRTEGTNVLLLNKSKSVLNSSLTATSFFRSSDNAEVLYSLDQARLTDGMFLSWDATNKMLVANNLVPEGIKLYFGTSSHYIDYHNEGVGYIRFTTNTGFLKFSTNNIFTTFRSSSNNGFQFIGKIETYDGVLNSFFDNFTIGTKQGRGSIKLYIGESSYITTPFSAVTFKRSSDDSEVLYQADLKSVLTGKETNYAPTVKAVSDAIDAVNTGTTESLKNYLKLSGGTMTGSIRIVDTGSASSLTGILNNDGTKALLFTYLKESENRWGVGTKEYVGVIRSNVSDLIHLVNNNGTLSEYSIYDKRNLPDPATKSGNNSFTGTNSFVGGKFSVAGSESEVYVSAVGNLVTRSTYGTTHWLRSLEFSDNDVVVARFGVNATTKNNVPTTNFVGILVGNGSVNDSQYKFGTNKLTVPESWSMIDGKNDAITLTSNSSIFGRISTPLYLRGDNTDLFHTKNSTNYKVWDASNLPTPASTSDIPDVSDMARRSEANTFTANNTFTAGQFNVGPLKVTSSGSILVNLSETGGWARNITWKNNSDQSTKVMVGGYHNAGDAFVWMGVGDLSYKESQYRFYGTKMVVPIAWSLDDKSGNSLVWSESTQLAHLGRAMGTTKIRSGAVDLIHTKGTTDYKILDESNYSQYLPTSSKWTYGFVATSPGETKVDFNTVLSGPDSPKILLNYNHQLGSDTNAPSGMTYGTVLQIDGNYNSNYNNNALRPQLAFDVNHNVEASTRYMWFRTANNLGFGDSSNWKRVVTADENVAGLSLDNNGYPAIIKLGGTSYNYTRVTGSGLLPNVAVSIANGGQSSLGTSTWSFASAYIAKVYANNYYFGNTGMHLEATGDELSLLNTGVAKKLKIGSLLVSANYSDTVKVPTNGIYSMGRIQSNDSMLVGYSGDVTGGMLGYGLYYKGTFAQGLGSEYSSGALVLYKMLNPNKGKAGYNVPRAVTGTPTYLKINSGYLTLGVGENKAYTAGEDVTVTEYTVLHQGNGFYLGVPTTCVPVMMDAAKAALATGNGYLEWWNSGAGWVNHRAGKYIVHGGSSSQFLKGDGSLDSTAYYPNVGRGYLSFDADGRPVISNNQGYSARDKDGVAREIMWISTENKLMLGNTSTNTVLSDIVFRYGEGHTLAVSAIASQSWVNTKLGSYLPLTGGTLTGTLKINSGGSEPLVINNSASAGEAYVVPQTQGTTRGAMGWNASLGMFLQDSRGYTFSVKADGVYFGASSSSLTKLLTSADLSSYATQSWVTSQGYLTSITKSMVTTALGYTPPTTNTTYSQATSSTLGLVKIGATGLASKNYAVQLNSSGQMYVAVPWTDTNTTYSAATSSTYGLVKIGATGLAAKNYAVQLNSSGQMYVAVPWTDTDTNTHYTTRLYAGASGTAANSATTSPYIKVTDDDTYRNQIRLLGGGATSVSSDASGNITITSTNTTYGLATASSNGLMSSSQYTKLSNCIETVSATNMVTSVQVVDTIPATSSQVTGRLYLKFA